MRLCVLLLALTATTPAVAQTASPTSPAPVGQVPQFPPLPSKSHVSTKYDKFTDSTTVYTQTDYFAVPSMKQIFMSTEPPKTKFLAAYQYEGTAQRDTVRSVLLAITTTQTAGTQTGGWGNDLHRVVKDNVAAGDGTLYLILDGGERMRLPAPIVDKDIRIGEILTDAKRTYAALIPISDFLKVVNSEQVEGKIGNAQFKLGRRELGNLRDLAALANPALLTK